MTVKQALRAIAEAAVANHPITRLESVFDRRRARRQARIAKLAAFYNISL